jgi:hypothetical protein
LKPVNDKRTGRRQRQGTAALELAEGHSNQCKNKDLCKAHLETLIDPVGGRVRRKNDKQNQNQAQNDSQRVFFCDETSM